MTNPGSLSDGLVKLEQIVRPLVFDDTITSDDFRGGATTGANSMLGRYLVYGDGSWSGPGGFVTRRLGTILTGQVEAEADYRARIASVLNLEPILSEIKRMREVVEAARHLPREVPGPGGTSTSHQFSIEAGVIWSLDKALRALDALSTLSPQEPDNEPD